MSQKVCKQCSTITETEKSFCPECGTSYLAETEPTKMATTDGAGFATTGLVCGIIAFLFIPFLFGTLGIIFGSIAWNKGHPRGKTATITSIAGLIVGLIFSILVWNAL